MTKIKFIALHLAISIAVLISCSKREMNYYILVNDAFGVTKGTEVRKQGIQIGTVKDIQLINDVVRIDFVIDYDVSVRSETVASILYLNMCSGPYIQLSHSSILSGSWLEPGSEIPVSDRTTVIVSKDEILKLTDSLSDLFYKNDK